MNKPVYAENYDGMSALAADMTVRTVRDNPRAVVVIATGGSPRLAYRITAEAPFTLLKLHPGCTCFVDRTAF